LTKKLHELTKTTPALAGVVVHKTNLGQGKRQVWIGVETSSQLRTTYAPPPPSTHLATLPAPTHLEAHRAAVITKLRKKLIALCSKCNNASPPSLAFERWLFDCLLVEEMSPPHTTTVSDRNALQNEDDPLFGPLCRRTELENCSLVLDLTRATLSKSTSITIAQNLQRTAHEMMAVASSSSSASSTSSASSSSSSSSSSSHSSSVVVVHHRHTLDIKYGRHGKRLLKLNNEHYRKMFDLWTLTKYGPSNAEDNNEARDESNRNIFHDDLYVMLSRYFAMQGHGFQAACPEHVFQVLHTALGVSFECFASPLNCYFGAYCSAFPDVDQPFGSSGSFWKWKPPLEGGSFQANPPFVAIVMKHMALKILQLLTSKGGGSSGGSGGGGIPSYEKPLSFVVVVPGWLEDEGYNLMSSSSSKRAHWLIAKEEHGFCDGAQHQRRDRFRSSPYDTAIFVLQNEAGALKWPVNTSVETELRRAFAAGVPTASAIARRKRDGRGFADEDGGGGVYKGKKKRRTGQGVVQRIKAEKKNGKKRKGKVWKKKKDQSR